MGTGRKFRKTPMTRPVKSNRARKRRQLEQRRRLIGLGVSEDVVAKMNVKDIRTMLRKPKAIQPTAT